MEFSQISSLLVVAAIAGIVAKYFKQPLIIGYLLAGFVLAFFGIIKNDAALSGLGQIGVTLLLFLVGLEMNLGELPSIGRVALIVGIGQVAFTTLLGFLLAVLLGFAVLPSLYISIALSFSSTIIVVKLLGEKNDLFSLYGRIATGILLVQDFVAFVLLIFLSGLGKGDLSFVNLFVISFKAIALFILVWALSKKILPNIFERFVASSPELLFIGGTAWALGVSSLVAGPLGFSFEIGGFLAGLALSNLPEHLQIASRTRPLRDFFLTIFFMLLGTSVLFGSIGSIWVPAIVLSLLVLIGHPIIVFILLGLLGYKKRTSFLTGLSVAQISEFSFILMATGLALGHVSEAEVATVVLVGAITMTASTYLILEAKKLYPKLKKYLSIFEKDTTYESVLMEETSLTDHIILIGSGRTGRNLLSFFKKKKWPFLVVDNNPNVFHRLTAERTPVLFGDIGDEEVLDLAKLERARLVVSTVSELNENLNLLERIRTLKIRPLTIFTAKTREEAIKYYEKGAAYVMVPQTIAGEHLRYLFRNYGLSSERFHKIGKGHFNRLISR